MGDSVAARARTRSGVADVVCIWCLTPDPEPSVEDIVPAALGCPPDLTFRRGEVCLHCNNGNGHIDLAVVDQLDLVAFHFGISRRGGQPPRVDNRGNFRGEWSDTGQVYSFNLDPAPVTTPEGKRLAGSSGRPRNIRPTITRLGDEARISFSVQLDDNKKFIRGIHKIAFELLAHYLGPQTVLTRRFDAVRSFVRRGEGHRYILLGQSAAPPPLIDVVHLEDAERFDVTMFSLLGIRFMVDFSPTQEHLPGYIRRLRQTVGTQGWGWYPVNPPPPGSD
jgi:hypothetical protein